MRRYEATTIDKAREVVRVLRARNHLEACIHVLVEECGLDVLLARNTEPDVDDPEDLVCPQCGGTNISYASWVNANTKELLPCSPPISRHRYCDDCDVTGIEVFIPRSKWEADRKAAAIEAKKLLTGEPKP